MRQSLLLLSLWACTHLHAQTPCVGGMAGPYPCNNVDLMSFVPRSTFGGDLNDCWGWTDPNNAKEYALVGLTTGTAFVDITDPVNPVLVGSLPTHTFNSTWRDIKVYNGHAFIVSEASNHGMQVFDLSRLDTVSNPPVTFTANAHNASFGRAHNIVINEDVGMAYVVGANQCGGGLWMLNISDPVNPILAGCHDLDGYIHDAQCVIYHGPDVAYQGQRICFNCHSGADKLSIVDVTDPTDPQHISIGTWSPANIGHQGWLSEDHRFFFIGDEGDEQVNGHNTRTRVFDVSDLDTPVLLGYHDGSTGAIDHNMYTHANVLYQANYQAGLQVLDILDPANPGPGLVEVAFFDTYPSSNGASFNGAWSVYPYFPSGNVIISSIDEGLFVVRPPVAGRIPLRVKLQGPYEAGTGLMNDHLRVQGLLPFTEPYTALGYTHVGGGGESTAAPVFSITGPNAIVDWVILELRDRNDPTQVLATRSGLLQRDGDVVDMDGTTPVEFTVPMGLYHVAVRHRNHLGVMSKQPLPVGISNKVQDLSNGSIDLFGTEPALDLNGTLLLWSGNALGDDRVKYTGGSNDRDEVLQAIGGVVPTATITGYASQDVDLNGEVKYTGSGNDRDPILQNIGGVVPTTVRVEQLP